MRIMTDEGPVPHAWMDGALLSDETHGMRFRIVVGQAGGFACDKVESEAVLTPRTSSKLALDAALSVAMGIALTEQGETHETTGIPSASFTTDDGRPAWPEGDGRTNGSEVLGDLSRMSDDELAFEEQSLRTGNSRRYVAGIGFFALAAAAAFWMWAGPLVAGSFLLGFALTSWRKVSSVLRDAATGKRRRMAMDVAIAREWERRIIAASA